jgi:hypothetical protein
MDEALYCNICGVNYFVAGPGGRKARTGALPQCSRCHSLERHRAIREALRALPHRILAEMRALHFSPDGMLAPLDFHSYEPSIFKGPNHLDLREIDRPDGAYDFVALSHLLEYIKDDRSVVVELCRIISERGVLLICFSNKLLEKGSIEYDKPQPPSGNYRSYGHDILARFGPPHTAISAVLKVAMKDNVTDQDEEFFLFFRSGGRAEEFRRAFDANGVVVSPIVRPPYPDATGFASRPR